jgi:hypothetical protein
LARQLHLDDVQRVADQVGVLRDARLLSPGATQHLIDTYLRPRWQVRLAGDIGPVAAGLERQHWVTCVERVGMNRSPPIQPGARAAWYETTLLIGEVNAGAVLEGLVCGSAYLIFAVAIVSAAASLARTTLGTVGIALAVLLLLPLVATITAVHTWLPSNLAAAPIDLPATTHLSDYLPALMVVAAAAGLFTFAVERFRASRSLTAPAATHHRHVAYMSHRSTAQNYGICRDRSSRRRGGSLDSDRRPAGASWSRRALIRLDHKVLRAE